MKLLRAVSRSYGKWVAKRGQRRRRRFPIVSIIWTVPWKKERGRREKQTRWTEGHEERHKSMTYAKWSGNDKPSLTLQDLPHGGLEKGRLWTWAKVSSWLFVLGTNVSELLRHVDDHTMSCGVVWDSGIVPRLVVTLWLQDRKNEISHLTEIKWQTKQVYWG